MNESLFAKHLTFYLPPDLLVTVNLVQSDETSIKDKLLSESSLLIHLAIVRRWPSKL